MGSFGRRRPGSALKQECGPEWSFLGDERRQIFLKAAVSVVQDTSVNASGSCEQAGVVS